jgi:hypothetical protein
MHKKNDLNSWDLYAEQIRLLSCRLGSQKNELEFLAFKIDLDSGQVFDNIQKKYIEKPGTLYVLLSHYSSANLSEETGNLVKFRDLPGGYAYERAFIARSADPIAKIFGNKTDMLAEAAKIINGKQVDYGDLAVKIVSLPKIPVFYILWKAEEFPASGTILFDESASQILCTEDLAVLGELITMRLQVSADAL